MELKTKIDAEPGRQDLVITREFDLPLALLFRAYTAPELVAQWMGTKVLKLDNKKHGGWEFETTDAQGAVVFRAHGVIHTFVPDREIVRTFQMEPGSFPTQLEFLEFERLTDDTSRLRMQIVYRSATHRDGMLQLPFARGISMAHDRLQTIVSQLKQH